MKIFKKFMFVFMLLVSFVSLTACGNKNDGGDSKPKTYTVSSSEQNVVGVQQLVIENSEVKESEDSSFYLILKAGYEKGTLSVLCNGTELVETRVENKNDSLYLYYKITNITENKIITFTGTTTIKKYYVSVVWNDFLDAIEANDKDINNFFVDMKFESSIGEDENSTFYNFEAKDFKDYIKSNMISSVFFYYGDTITITVYAKDNCESFVDGFVLYNSETLKPSSEKVTETINGSEVSYLKAKYTFNIIGDTSLTFYEQAIVRSNKVAN